MLEQNAWRITETAGHLGISRKALWDKMRRLEVAREGERSGGCPCNHHEITYSIYEISW